jgi:hypothetical protein
VKKISSRGREVPEKIRDLEPFQTYGALRAEVFSDHGMNIWQTGILSGYDLEKFREHQNYIRYAVFSYSTPIAWWSPAYGWHRVRQTFSITTSRHQGNLYLITGPGSETRRWQPWFDASLRNDLVCRRVRGKHEGPVGYTDDGTLCERHYLMRPAVKRMQVSETRIGADA